MSVCVCTRGVVEDVHSANGSQSISPCVSELTSPHCFMFIWRPHSTRGSSLPPKAMAKFQGLELC